MYTDRFTEINDRPTIFTFQGHVFHRMIVSFVKFQLYTISYDRYTTAIKLNMVYNIVNFLKLIWAV